MAPAGEANSTRRPISTNYAIRAFSYLAILWLIPYKSGVYRIGLLDRAFFGGGIVLIEGVAVNGHTYLWAWFIP